MAVKNVKATRLVGRANDNGRSFTNDEFVYQLRQAFEQVQARAHAMSAITTAPANIYIIVEQEVIVDDSE